MQIPVLCPEISKPEIVPLLAPGRTVIPQSSGGPDAVCWSAHAPRDPQITTAATRRDFFIVPNLFPEVPGLHEDEACSEGGIGHAAHDDPLPFLRPLGGSEQQQLASNEQRQTYLPAPPPPATHCYLPAPLKVIVMVLVNDPSASERRPMTCMPPAVPTTPFLQ